VDSDAISQLLIIYSVFVKYLRKIEYSEAVHRLFIDLKKAYDSFRKEACIIFSLIWYPQETGKANKNLSETRSRVRVGKNLRCFLFGMV
jgi:hypothetical protein